MWWSNPFWLLAFVLVFPILLYSNIGWIKKLFKKFYLKKSNDFKLNKILQNLTTLRIIIIIITIFALAGTSILLPIKKHEIVILFDVSQSIAKEQIERSRINAIDMIKKMKNKDKISIITFAGDTNILSESLSPDETIRLLDTTQLNASNDEQTDLYKALRVGTELLKKKYGDRYMVLFSDGRPTLGDPILTTSGDIYSIPIYTVPSGTSTNEVITKALTIPEVIHQNENIFTEWELTSNKKQSIITTIKIDDKVIEKKKIDLLKGNNKIQLVINSGSSGVHNMAIEAKTNDGKNLKRAEIESLFTVKGSPKVLIINGNSYNTPVSNALRIQGFSVDTKSIEELPDKASGYIGYQAVILDNVHALYITESQQYELQNYVSGGGGLLIVGGDKSLGRGDYFDTPLEEMLPVESDIRQRLFYARSSILFVIDHSGSMSEMVGNTSKQIAAMQGVARSIKELDPNDEVGILTFDEQPSWVIGFTPAKEINKIMDKLSTLQEGGGTNMESAFKEVVKTFFELGPRKRHVIVLTDGLTSAANFQEYTNKLISLGVTVSTIGIGNEINETLLRSIANWGGGKFYRAELDQIPRVMTKETIRMTRELMQEGNFKLQIKNKSSMVEGILDYRQYISGYILTKAKEMSNVYLETKNKESPDKMDPILVSWRYGNGNVAVFTSDSGKRWLSSWSNNISFNRLWSQILRSIERGSLDQGLRTNAEIEAGSIHLSVDAIGEDRKLKTGLKLIGWQLDNKDNIFNLSETLSGHYEAYVPIEGSGLMQYEIKDIHNNTYGLAWVWNTPGNELNNSGPDMTMLEKISEISKGKILNINEYSIPKTRWSISHYRIDIFLLLIALTLFLVELFFRSTSFGQLSMVKALISVWWTAQNRLIEVIKNAKFEKVQVSDSDIDHAKTMDAYKYLATKIQERNSQTKINKKK